MTDEQIEQVLRFVQGSGRDREEMLKSWALQGRTVVDRMPECSEVSDVLLGMLILGAMTFEHLVREEVIAL